MKKITTLAMAAVLTMSVLIGIQANAYEVARPDLGNMMVCIDESEYKVLGLRTDGTLNSMGYSNDEIEVINSITNAVQISDGVILKNDGTVQAIGQFYASNRANVKEDVRSWIDIAYVSRGRNHIVGLKNDGTVVATGENANGQCNVIGWKNVKSICARDNYTIGIKEDGSVLIAGQVDNAGDTRDWKDMKKVVFDGTHFYGLTSDGTIISNKKDCKIISAKVDNASIGKIIDLNSYGNVFGFYNMVLFALDESGNLIKIDKEKTLVEKNIKNFVCSISSYIAVDNNGQIWSDQLSFSSDDWILTTNLTYKGKKIETDAAPYVKDGRTLAPLRAVLETLGATVNWDESTNTVIADRADIKIEITINSSIAKVNGVDKALDVPAEITNNRTFIPVRFIAENFNCKVDWDQYTKTVIIE